MDLLSREGLQAKDLNDDSLRRALDRLYEAGVTEVSARVVSHVLQMYGLLHCFVHLDSTSVSLQGKYSPDAEDLRAIRITHGYSKDQRSDLKQAVGALICTYRSAIPVWLEVLSGNSADQPTFLQTMPAYVAQLQAAVRPCFIADSALYSQGMLKSLWAIRWITRVPETIQEARHLLQHLEPGERPPSAQEGSATVRPPPSTGACGSAGWSPSPSKPMSARWRRFGSSCAGSRSNPQSTCGICAIGSLALRKPLRSPWLPWRSHGAFIERRCHSKLFFYYGRRGRPRAGVTPQQVRWCVVREVVEAPAAIAVALKSKGKFILATNDTKPAQLPTDTMLAAYKAQGVSVERRFRFLKEPLFFAYSLFLTRPERLMALLMMMGLALLVYALAAHTVRTELGRRGENLPDQRGHPTQRPTMRWIFQLFEGIDVLWLRQPLGVQHFVLNLKPIHHQILHILVPEVQKCYALHG